MTDNKLLTLDCVDCGTLFTDYGQGRVCPDCKKASEVRPKPKCNCSKCRKRRVANDRR